MGFLSAQQVYDDPKRWLSVMHDEGAQAGAQLLES